MSQMLRDIIAARPKSLAFLAFLALLALGSGLYLALWQRPELEKARAEWFSRREALARGETVADSARYAMGLRDLEELEKRLVPKKEFTALLSQLYETARGNSLTLSGISYRPGKEGDLAPGIIPYGISLTVSGKYGAVKSFLADLVRYREMLTVDSVSLRNQSPTEESVSLSVQTTLYLKREGA